MIQTAIKRNGIHPFAEGIGSCLFRHKNLQIGVRRNCMERNSTRCMFHCSSYYGMPIKVNVGHGPGYAKSPQQMKNIEKESQLGNESMKFEITAQQKKANVLELERMENSTKRLLTLRVPADGASKLHIDQFDSLALVNEVRVALNYWASRWQTHYGDGKTGNSHQKYNFGAQRVEALLDWILDVQTNLDKRKSNINFLEKILAPDKNAVFVNLIDAYLLPCQQQQHFQQFQKQNENHLPSNEDDMTYYIHRRSIQSDNLKYEGSPRDENVARQGNLMADSTLLFDTSDFSYSSKDINPIVWKSALTSAFDVLEKMNVIHNKTGCSLKPNVWSNNAYLLVLSKLSHFLGSDAHLKNNADLSFINKSFRSQEWTSAQDVLNEMEVILTKLEEDHPVATQNYFQQNEGQLDVTSYNIFLSALVRSQLPESLDKAHHILQRLEKTEDQDRMSEDLETDLSVMDNVDENNEIRCSTLKRTAAYADVVTYNCILHAYTSIQSHMNYNNERKHISNCKIAANILSRLEDRYNSIQRPELKPDTRSFATVLYAYAGAGNAEAAEEILHKIIRLSTLNEWKDKVAPNNICFNSTMYAWAKSKDPKAAENAEAILSKMEDLSKSHDASLGIQPDTVSYATVISAWARSGRPDCALRAEKVLQRSLDMFRQGNEDVKPDSITFNSVLDAWAKQNANEVQNKNSYDPNSSLNNDATLSAATQAEVLVSQMEELSSQKNMNIRPCTITYNTLMDIYAKIPNAAKAEELLRKMINQYNSGNSHVKPDVITFNSILFALSTSSTEELDKAEELLKQMEESSDSKEKNSQYSGFLVKPDTVSYNTVMNAIAKRSDSESASKAEKILMSLIQRYRAGDNKSKPNNSSFNIVMNAWSKSGSKNAADRANHILDKMIEFSNEIGDDSIAPDTVSFTCVVDALSRSHEPDAPRRAEKLLSQMYELKNAPPNKVTFNSVINAWSRSSEKGAAVRAEKILLQMEELGKDRKSGISPDSITFSSVINAWARSGEKGAAPRAESILLRMKELQNLGNSQVKPTQYTYGAVLNAWARSGREDASRRALSLLTQMEEALKNGDSNIRPNSHCYNAGKAIM